MVWWQRWVYGWLELFEGIFRVITFGIPKGGPKWTFRWCCWIIDKNCERVRKRAGLEDEDV